MIKRHHLFGVQTLTRNIITKFRPCYPPPAGSNVCCEITIYNPVGKIYDSLPELEKDFLASIVSKYENNPTLYPSPHYALDMSEGISEFTKFLPFQRINQVQSTVATRTRRGWPTVLIINPYLLDILKYYSYQYYDGRMLNFNPSFKMFKESILTPIGYYLGKGYSGCELYCNENWGPRTPAIMGYNGGGYDAGPYLIPLDNGKYQLELPIETNPSVIAPWDRYINLMQIL